jgi:hypothetical protein
VSAQGGTAHILAPTDHPQQAIRPRLSRDFSAFIVVCAAGGVLLAFFLGVYKANQYRMPIGYDTPRYLFQSTLVADLGVAHVPHLLPPPSRSLATRTGFPVLVLTLSSLFSTSTFKAGAMVPVVSAAALALAAGALVSWGLRRTAWELGAVTLIVGTSAVMVRLMVPEMYTDNLMAAAVLVAALIPTVSAIRDGPGLICATVLLATGGVIHPQFFALFAGILGLAALIYLPASWRSWRSGEAELLHTVAGRLGFIILCAVAIAAIVFFASVRSWPVGARQTRTELIGKLRSDLPLHRFPLTVPVAVFGLTLLAALGLRRAGPAESSEVLPSGPGVRFAARFLFTLSAVWGLVTLLGVLDFYRGSNTAAHRLLSFLLPFPLLMAVGILGLGRVLAVRTPWSAAGVAIVIVVIGTFAFLGYRDLYVNVPATRGIEFMDTGKIKEAAMAQAYLERSVSEERPVVFVIDDRGPNPLSWVPEMAYMIRTVLPAERMLNTYIYVGDPANYLAGKPTLRTTPRGYNGNLWYWPMIQRVLPRHPVALLLASYNDAYEPFVATHPGSVIAPRVALLAGPRPRAPIGQVAFPTGPRGVVPTGLLALGTFLVLSLVGVSWAWAGLPRSVRPFEVLALCPAIGIGTLVVGGNLVDAAGFRLKGVVGAMTPLLVAAVGLLAAWVIRRRPKRDPLIRVGTL